MLLGLLCNCLFFFIGDMSP